MPGMERPGTSDRRWKLDPASAMAHASTAFALRTRRLMAGLGHVHQLRPEGEHHRRLRVTTVFRPLRLVNELAHVLQGDQAGVDDPDRDAIPVMEMVSRHQYRRQVGHPMAIDQDNTPVAVVQHAPGDIDDEVRKRFRLEVDRAGIRQVTSRVPDIDGRSNDGPGLSGNPPRKCPRPSTCRSSACNGHRGSRSCQGE
jgi:hypothetical protein